MVKTTLKNIQEKIKKELEDILMHHYQDDLQLNGSHPCLPLEVSIGKLISKAYNAGVEEGQAMTAKLNKKAYDLAFKGGVARGQAFIGKAKREWYERGFKEGKKEIIEAIKNISMTNLTYDKFEGVLSDYLIKQENSLTPKECLCEKISGGVNHHGCPIHVAFVTNLTPKETYEEGYAKGQSDMIDIYNITPNNCKCCHRPHKAFTVLPKR